MIKNNYLLLPILLFSLLFGQCEKSEPTQQVDTSILPASYISKLGKGMDVIWVETTNGISGYTYQAVVDMKNKGFSHVRIRVHLATIDYVQLDKVINDCLRVGLIPILACQADDFETNPTGSNMDNLVLFWKTVAERYQNYSSLLSFNLIVEPDGTLTAINLNTAYEKVVTAIRVSNPKRIIFIAPRKLSDPTYLTELMIPTQANGYLIGEWHFYAAGPSKTVSNKLWTTGTAAEKKLITDKIQLAKDWETKTGIKTWVGAWMPGNYNNGNDYTVVEQVVFSSFMSCQLTKASIPFAINADHQFYDATTNQWIGTLLPVINKILNPINCP